MDIDLLIDELPGASPELRILARCGLPRDYARGRLLIEEGESSDTLFIILSGRLRAFSVADNGREITYGSYGPGEYVGEMGLDGGPRAANVEAVERCICSVVPRRALEEFIADNPAFAFELMAKLIRRVRAATLSARQMALNDVYGRLRWLLESRAQFDPQRGQRVVARLTHLEMAQHIGSSREMVSRLMKDLERGGFVIIEKDGIYLPTPLPARW